MRELGLKRFAIMEMTTAPTPPSEPPWTVLEPGRPALGRRRMRRHPCRGAPRACRRAWGRRRRRPPAGLFLVSLRLEWFVGLALRLLAPPSAVYPLRAL